MSAVLALPRLPGYVPRAILPLGHRRANAGLARFLVEAGVLSAADVPEAWSDALEVCQRALDAWIKRRIGPLHCLSPLFVLDADEGRTFTRATAPPAAYASARLFWLEANERPWVVGPGLEALERAHAGLGGAVIEVLGAQYLAYPVFTPETACDIVSYLHWSGEEDEEAALDMQCGDDPQERAEAREQMVTRATLDEAFPRWAQRPNPAPVRRRTLRRFAAGTGDLRVDGIVADALALSRLRFGGRYAPEIEGEFIGWGAVLCWAEDDLTVRVYDDLLNLAHQSQYCDVMGEVELALDAPAVMAQWQKEMSARFRAIRLIDGLIHALAEGDWSHA